MTIYDTINSERQRLASAQSLLNVMTLDADALNAQIAAEQASAATATAAAALAQQELADYKAYVLGKLGPLGLEEWQKVEYRGYPLDLTGYVETFRDDFDSLDTITGPDGDGPWFSSVHTYFGNAYFDSIEENPGLYRLDEPGVLTLRMETPDGDVNTSWRTGIIETMAKTGVRGFRQSKGVFEARVKMPGTAATKGLPGFWGAFWLLAAGDHDPAITDNLIEIDPFENYGGDLGIHTSVHVKPRRPEHRLPTDYPTRVSKSLYTNPATVINTETGEHVFGADATIYDGQFHTYTTVIDDDWVTQYYDGFSIGRYPNINGYFSTPLYMLVNETLKRPSGNVGLVSPIDMQVDYVRAMAKPSAS